MPEKTSPRKIYRRYVNTAAFVAGVVTFLLGAYLVWASVQMPVFDDETAYNNTYEQIGVDLANNTIDYSGASERFYKNQDDNMSGKYMLESAGWSLVVTSMYILIYGCWVWYIRAKQKLPHVAWLYLLAALNVGLCLILGLISIVMQASRGLYPHWADSLGIPLFSTILMSPVLLGFTMGIVGIVTVKYTRASFSHEIGTLPRPYKVYFVMSGLALCLLLINIVRYPEYASTCLLVGSVLFNYFVFVGVQRNARSRKISKL